MTNIKIIDAPCGAGKTSYAKQLMLDNTEEKFIYITPFCDEITRIRREVKDMCEPNSVNSCKFEHFNKLLIEGRNIASTHALFRMCTQETRDYIEGNGYTLILDEVMDVLEQLPLKKDDLPTMIKTGLVEINDDGLLIWIDDDYSGRYDDVKQMCKNKSVFVVDGCCLMWTFPIEVFNSFKEVYILTYMFKSQLQRYYYDLYHVEYEYKTVSNSDGRYHLVDYVETKNNVDKINICQNNGINFIGEANYSLSKGWYEKNKYTKLKLLKNNIVNYVIHIAKAKSKDVIWTTFKDYISILKGKGYSTAFLPCNSRSTNEYMGRHNVIYTINVYMSPMIVKFFANNGVQIDQDSYALSEMIQFIYRSAIRNNEQIYCYIPSKRMRELLEIYVSGGQISQN